MRANITNKMTFIIIVLSFLFMTNIPTGYAANYIDFSDRHTYVNETLKELVEVYAYDESYDTNEAQQMIDHIGKVPEIILQKALDENVRLIFVDFPITDLDEFSHLRGEQPRGHADGSVWDDIPGGGGEITVARIGYSEPGKSHGSLNLEYHEFGHAIEYALFDNDIYANDQFVAIHQAEKDQMFPYDDYMDYIDEYFAEVFSYYFLSEQHAAELADNAPETYTFLENLSAYVLLVEENTSENIVLTWDTLDEVAYYEVLRDGMLIDTVTEGKYVDTTFDSHMYHDYTVLAYYVDGKLRHETAGVHVLTEANEVMTLTDANQIRIDEVSESHINLSWDMVDKASYYEVYRDGELIGKIHIPFFDDFELEADTTYTYEVKAYNINDTAIELPQITVQTEEMSSNWIWMIVIGGILFVFFIMMILIITGIYLAFKRKKQIKHRY